LLIVGMLMEIFSAVVVVPPLIAPIGAHFGIDPYHLGAIFLLNLEIAYLAPPLGLNLFISSFRFEKTLPTVYKAVIPFVLILSGALLLVSYVPQLSTWSSRLVAPVNLDAVPDKGAPPAGSAPEPLESATPALDEADAGAPKNEGEQPSGSGETLEDLLREDKAPADEKADAGVDAGGKIGGDKAGGETLEDLLREAQ
jgi:hypothetical protein